MGLETRNGHLVYYRKVWRNGTCVSEYVGGGEFGRLMAEADALIRDQDAAREADWRAERRRLEAEDQAHREYFDEVERIVRDSLEAAGYHQHHGGEWRRRRASEGTGDPGAARPAGGGG